MDISETGIVDDNDKTIRYYTTVTAHDEDDNYSAYWIGYYGTLDNVYKDDYIYVYGLPIGREVGKVAIAGSIVGKYGENPSLTNNTAAEPTITQDAEVVEDMAENEQLSDDPYYPGGVWNMTYDGGGNTINIAYDPNNDVFLASFSGSYDAYAGGTDGYLVATPLFSK